MKKINLTYNDVECLTQDILRQLFDDNWKPDYVVGLTRGGLLPAILISQYLNVPMETLKVSLRDGVGGESNCWMPEDAIGYIPHEDRKDNGGWSYLNSRRKKILIVDDINDTGATLNWIKQDWHSSIAGICSASEWDTVWGDNVRVAVLVDNDASECTIPINYSGMDINKAADPSWICFPVEEWWKK